MRYEEPESRALWAFDCQEPVKSEPVPQSIGTYSKELESPLDEEPQLYAQPQDPSKAPARDAVL